MTEQEEKDILLKDKLQRETMERRICLNCGDNVPENSNKMVQTYEQTGLCHNCQNG